MNDELQGFAYEAPVATKLDHGQVSALADSFAKEFEFRPGGDLIELTRRLGGRVEPKDFLGPEVDTASIEVRAEGDFVVFVPSFTSAERYRLTIAHELAHYILHYCWARTEEGRQFSRPLKASRYGSSPAEDEANVFAAALLMPSDSFRSVFNSCNRDLSQVANRFKVSVSAAKLRAKALGLTGDAQG